MHIAVMRAVCTTAQTQQEPRRDAAARWRRWLAESGLPGRVAIVGGIPTRLEVVGGRVVPVAVFRAA
jgi:hypothetical protein